MAVDVQEILERFTTEEHPPILNRVQQLAVRQYFADRHMENIFGSIALNEAASKTSLLLQHDPDGGRILQDTPDAILGPEIIGDDYYAHGVAIWAPNETEQSLSN